MSLSINNNLILGEGGHLSKIDDIKPKQNDINANNAITLNKQEELNAIAIAKFKEKNNNDDALEKKVMFIQRHIRAKLRRDSEIKRISELGLNPTEVFEDANTPYRPRECSQELADRMMKFADQIVLYTSIKHLTAIEHIDKIMDGCLYGRDNLNSLHMTFRKAALGDWDIEQGDGNVICFAPDLIDPKCMKDRTMGLEFNLENILNDKDFNRNPCIFFKQKDLMYNPDFMEYHRVKIKDEILTFGLEGNRFGDNQSLYIYEKGNGLEYQSSLRIDSCKLISYNLKDMKKILILNSFRFIDSLQDKNLVQNIYSLIAELNDQELVEFLTNLGKGMSCASEFNFYGAYKIDLDSLINLHFYDTTYRRNTSRLNKDDVTIEMKKLFDELNNNSFESFYKIKQLAPELLKSSRFVEFLLSKISDSQISARVINLIKVKE